MIQNHEPIIVDLLHKATGHDVGIRIYDNPWQGKWCFYPRLNIIAPRNPSSSVKKYVFSQYDNRGGAVKIIGRKLARFGYLNSLGIMAAKSMDIESQGTIGRQMLFWGRTRGMRLFDFHDQILIYKRNKIDDNFKKLLEFRQNHNYDFVPELMEHGADWYKEAVIWGKTLGLYKGRKDYTALLRHSISLMKKIADDTVVLKLPQDYADELCRSITANIKELPDNTYKTLLNQIVDGLRHQSLQLGKPVPVVMAHCDLHKQNIMVDEQGKIFIIDWEAVDYRSIWYDPATLLLAFRRRAGLRHMLAKFDQPSLTRALLVNDDEKHYNMKSLMAFLLLENLWSKTNLAKESQWDIGEFLNDLAGYLSWEK